MEHLRRGEGPQQLRCHGRRQATPRRKMAETLAFFGMEPMETMVFISMFSHVQPVFGVAEMMVPIRDTHHQNLGHCCFYILWTLSQILSYAECSCAPKGLRTVNLSTWSHVQPYEHRNVFVFHLSHIQKKTWELQE